MKAVGYIRVSTIGQATEGISLDNQKSMIQAHCKAHGIELLEICRDEGLSGGRSDNRPGFQIALGLVCKNKAALIVHSLSRFARSTIDCMQIAKDIQSCGGSLVSLTESIDTTTAMGAFVFTIFAALGELELNQIKHRTRSAMQYKIANGEKTGGNPRYGFMFDGDKSVPNLEEQVLIGHIVHLRKKRLGLRRIARRLNEHGFTSRKGTPWRTRTIDLICKREYKP